MHPHRKQSLTFFPRKESREELVAFLISVRSEAFRAHLDCERFEPPRKHNAACELQKPGWPKMIAFHTIGGDNQQTSALCSFSKLASLSYCLTLHSEDSPKEDRKGLPSSHLPFYVAERLHLLLNTLCCRKFKSETNFCCKKFNSETTFCCRKFNLETTFCCTRSSNPKPATAAGNQSRKPPSGRRDLTRKARTHLHPQCSCDLKLLISPPLPPPSLI